MATPRVIHGDCIDEMRNMDEASVDAIVTDPPYGLGFMGKKWDALPPGEDWARECLRVLKPGGHLLAFGGTRTWHRLAVAVEDAGFEMRDSIAWLYGSGFPKSLDVSKAVDKAGGVSPAAQAHVLRDARLRANLSREQVAAEVGCTAASVRDWEEGRARSAGRAVEYITPSPQYRDRIADLLGYTDDERSITGASLDRRGDGTVIGLGHSGVSYGDATTDAAREWRGWGTALKPAFEPVVVARKPLEGTVAANVLRHGTGALNIDACRIEGNVPSVPQPVYGVRDDGITQFGAGVGRNGEMSMASGGRWPANVVLDEHAATLLDRQSGNVGANSVGKLTRDYTYEQTNQCPSDQQFDYGDKGGASRFFYVAKAPKKERPVYETDSGQKIQHATVKPLALMRWLVRLVAPPNGTVLDPFAGSGTTLEAALLEGFDVIGIERETEYLPLIQQRIDRIGNTLI